MPAHPSALESVVDEAWAHPCGDPPSAGCTYRLWAGDVVEERRAYTQLLMTSANMTIATGGVGCTSDDAYTNYYSLGEGSLSMERCHRLMGAQRVRMKACDANYKVCRFLDLSTNQEFWTEIHNVQAIN